MSSMKYRAALLGVVVISGLFLAIAIQFGVGKMLPAVYAAPIEPPAGYPKLNNSSMTATPDLLPTGGATLTYTLVVVNTGAYTATDVLVADVLPANTTYNKDATSSAFPPPDFVDGLLTWRGSVGFDSSVVIQFSVNVSPTFEGFLTNQAAISHASMENPFIVTAEAMVTDDPFFEITKVASPEVPGPDKPLTYSLFITNRGQPAVGLQVVVSDVLPADTSFLAPGPDGSYNDADRTVTWTRNVSLNRGESSEFSYSVLVGDVPSGTVITNEHYQVENPLSGVAVGEPYTVTVLDPILFIYKETDPFPPGSNRNVTYKITVLNKGSLATNLVVEDTLPEGVSYVDGGTLAGNTVSWDLPSLETGESAEVSFVVYIGDVAEVPILNSDYQVCSAEGVCQIGIPLTSVVKGPTFVATATVDPIAKKPGGGGGPVTPTLTIENLGPGYALDASAMLYFQRISVSSEDLVAIPDTGLLIDGPDCGDKCVAYHWVGNIGPGEMITFTTLEGQSSIGGEEGTHYTATIVVSDSLTLFSYDPITATAVGTITHFANLLPSKSAPEFIAAGQLMTYSFGIFNSGLTTDVPPYPVLTDTVPQSVTLVSVSDDGAFMDVGGQTVVSWTLPSLSTGERLGRSYVVQVDPDLVSGTLIVNDDYWTVWKDIAYISSTITQTYVMSNTGDPVTTMVRDIGLIDSFKTVTPTALLPGPSNVLTYVVHIANSSPTSLYGVQVHDLLPWEVSTYQRDAVASSGTVVSDIVSVDWSGDVGALSEELITFTVKIDPGYEGPVTNTAVITHSSLSADVVVQAVAYVTDDPVLSITKSASPDPVDFGDELLYTIHVANLGQQATELAVTDMLPSGTSFVPYSASGNGQMVGDVVTWSFPVLPGGEQQSLSFRVRANIFPEIVNQDYQVTCSEGVTSHGAPLVTQVTRSGSLFLPIVTR